MAWPVYLIGLPHSGVTQVALELAEALDAQLIDTDQSLAERFKVDPKTALVELGEDRFRQAEKELGAELWQQLAPGGTRAQSKLVIALGSGFLDHGENRKLLELPGADLFILDLDLNLVAVRSGFNRPRSVGLGLPRLWLKEFIEQRKTIWRTLEATWIEVGEMEAGAVAQKIKQVLGS